MIFTLWHNLLGMEKHDRLWHEQDIHDELIEYKKARKFFDRWSELSDVVYTYTRARWSGHKDFKFPLSRFLFLWGSLYMFPKYTLRWLFFLFAGKKAGSKKPIREVRNPQKDNKLDEISAHYGCDPILFRKICKRRISYWPLLK